ncbi:hypothetical protein [Arthrobacter sp. S2(2024)]|uniref:hypothetical protein n=1 Tax=Arthrobacter sp. S2(2024) TaxID=3111911 RepID=UPI002FC8D987
MITSPSNLAPKVTVSSRGAGEEAFAHMSRDGSQARVQAVILELSVKISPRLVLLEASSNYPTRCSEDMAASHGSSAPWRTWKPPSLDSPQ